MGIVHSLARLYIGGVSATYDYYADLAGDFEFVEHHAADRRRQRRTPGP